MFDRFGLNIVYYTELLVFTYTTQGKKVTLALYYSRSKSLLSWFLIIKEIGK